MSQTIDGQKVQFLARATPSALISIQRLLDKHTPRDSKFEPAHLHSTDDRKCGLDDR